MKTIRLLLSCQLLLTCIATAQQALKPYKEVITADSKSQDGLFKVHQVGEKIYFELPPDTLNRDMLWQAQEVDIPAPMGNPGLQGYRLIQWARRGNTIQLKAIDNSLRARGGGGISEAVRILTPQAIIAVFKIEAEGADGSAVIDVSDFLISDPNDLPVGTAWNARVQKNRSYVDKVKSFSQNVEIDSLLTFEVTPVNSIKPTTASFTWGIGPNLSLTLHYSFVMLPKEPMTPRFRDPRVGFFGILMEEYGGPENRPIQREMIKRYRLEKKDPNAALSEPVKPIVFYIAREVPEKWRSYIKRGVEAWKPAFEQAGFKDAIICRYPPTPQEDPDWDIANLNHSVIRWVPSRIENAFGQQIVDPRSGEVLSGQVTFYHSFLSWLQNLYFAQASPLDPEARQFPFSDKLIGRLLQYIITHEIGHTLGLEHNMKSSAPYTIAQLRDAAFVAKHDIAASIMDYARFDYVAQPGDNVPLERNIGEYDKFAIEWGYKPIPSAKSSYEELPTLNQWASRQNTNPFIRFGNYQHPEDPSTIGEDISNDPVEAARLGFKNVKRAAGYLVAATVKPGADYSQLGVTYAALVNQNEQLLDNVIRLVGGVLADDHRMMAGQTVYEGISAARQRAAVMMMCGPEGVPTPELYSPEIVKRLSAGGDINRVMQFQDIIVYSLFTERRILRMLDQEQRQGAKAYTVAQMLDDVQGCVWRQIDTQRVIIELPQRQYQLGYLNTLDAKLNGTTATKTVLQGLARNSLRMLARKIDKALPKADDKGTALHLAEARRQIEAILKGTSTASKLLPPPAAPPRIAGRAFAGCGWPVEHDNGLGITYPPKTEEK